MAMRLSTCRKLCKELNLKSQYNLRKLSNKASAYVHTDARHNKASSATLADAHLSWEKPASVLEHDSCYEKIDLSFRSYQEAFKSKTNGELLRALFIFNLCSIKPLITHNKKLMNISRAILGKTLFEKMMKATFYGQFVAGEDEQRIKPTVERNRSFGVKSILDYSVEKDLTKEQAQQATEDSLSGMEDNSSGSETSGVQTQFKPHPEVIGDRRENVTNARTYFYKDEEECDKNLEVFLRGIDCVSGATNSTGFSAIKLTALGRPQLLLQLSEVLARVRKFYDILAKVDETGEKTIGKRDFEKYLKSFDILKEERMKWYTVLDVSKSGKIDLLDWHNLLEVNINLGKLMRVPNLVTGQFEPLASSWTDEDEEQMRNMLNRMDRVASYCQEKDVRVMVDAEQTYFQVAINRLTMEMMRKYNKEKAIIFNTYQCYLKEALNSIKIDLALSAREDFFFGAKLVRGAYIEQERQRAESLNYPDPINPSYDATTAMYELVLEHTLSHVKQRPKGRVAIMVASHNEDTVRGTIETMKNYKIQASDKILCFGQLLGMCDHISFPLGQAGYSVYKYVPYGPVDDVIPYLSRRATENGSVVSKLKKEKSLLWSELKRRLLSGQIFYKPPTPDLPSP